MALQKTYNYKGIDLNYWKIIDSNESTITNKSNITVALYYSISARTNDIGNYFLTRQYEFDGIDLTREDIYPLIKDMGTNETIDQLNSSETKFFSDALDV